jgi:hypothetical protein
MMKAKDLTAKDLVEVLRLYEEHCGGRRSFESVMCRTPESLLKEIRKGDADGWYRIGSKWCYHSKILLRKNATTEEFLLDFYENFHPRDRKGEKYEQCQAAGRAFLEAARNYLRTKS